MKKITGFLLALLLILSVLFVAGCTTSKRSQNQAAGYSGEKIRIAIQYGLGYAPVQIVKEKKLIEKYLPGAQVEWKQMGGEMIREAMVSGDLDIGFTGQAPFWIAWDKGADWKICTALGSSPLGLVTYREDLKSLKDFKIGDKIATPYSGSIQHMLLAMAAEKELGNPKAMDKNLVSMQHPDAATAVVSKRAIAAHFSAPPYLYEELDTPGVELVLNGEDAFGGEFGFLVGSATRDFHDNHPTAYAAFVMAMDEAITFINNNPEEAAKILAPSYKMPAEKVEKYLTWPGTNYTSTPYGLLGFAEFMKKAGYISKVPKSLDEVCWENVTAAIGKKSGGLSPVEKAQYRDSNKNNKR
ncbi:ABC transporter substrate-binding protein [Thermincola potens]|uniref:ABC transporter substrate-binding protein n=1 Tax=Thermincola potens (strain JR) TaxID=635013 RepID=D5XB63_THEPJ|nr:ABC transporter substrate-binding protein [Thermincola potens]ADG81383.1 ABC transporter substrate-binding protein [Thermincola potens JR]